jgi:hypothetical protein
MQPKNMRPRLWPTVLGVATAVSASGSVRVAFIEQFLDLTA